MRLSLCVRTIINSDCSNSAATEQKNTIEQMERGATSSTDFEMKVTGGDDLQCCCCSFID